MQTLNNKDLLKIIVPFIRSIGITVHFESLNSDTFLPGIQIRKGELVVDASKIIYPGDLLHEAEHIACVYPHERPLLNDNVAPENAADAIEMGVIAWSYAALVHLELDADVVFHEGGYQEGGNHLKEIFLNNDMPIGLPLLEWMGLTTSKQNAKEGEIYFPKMIKWLRDDD